MKKQTLTLKEALEQGYTHYCYGHPSNGYQSLNDISDLNESEIEENTIYLASKESFSPKGIDHEELKDLIAEHIWNNHNDNTGDDTDAVFNAIKEIDFSDVVERIDSALAKLDNYRWITEISLINSPTELKED